MVAPERDLPQRARVTRVHQSPLLSYGSCPDPTLGRRARRAIGRANSSRELFRAGVGRELKRTNYGVWGTNYRQATDEDQGSRWKVTGREEVPLLALACPC